MDQEFATSQSNAGVDLAEQVEWLPLSMLAKMRGYEQPCYSIINADLQSPEMGHRNPDIKDAVYFLSFAKSQCLDELMKKPYDSQGAYTFNLFRNGVIVRTLIDELVPTINATPVYTPPYCERLYPALI